MLRGFVGSNLTTERSLRVYYCDPSLPTIKLFLSISADAAYE